MKKPMKPTMNTVGENEVIDTSKLKRMSKRGGKRRGKRKGSRK